MRICCPMCSRDKWEGVVYNCQCPLKLKQCHCDRWIYSLCFKWEFYIWGPLLWHLGLRERWRWKKLLIFYAFDYMRWWSYWLYATTTPMADPRTMSLFYRHYSWWYGRYLDVWGWSKLGLPINRHWGKK